MVKVGIKPNWEFVPNFPIFFSDASPKIVLLLLVQFHPNPTTHNILYVSVHFSDDPRLWLKPGGPLSRRINKIVPSVQNSLSTVQGPSTSKCQIYQNLARWGSHHHQPLPRGSTQKDSTSPGRGSDSQPADLPEITPWNHTVDPARHEFWMRSSCSYCLILPIQENSWREDEVLAACCVVFLKS